MLDFVIFAVVFILFLLGLLFLLYPGKPKQVCNVPGPDPADEKTGNLPDIRDAGSLHEFLVQLHDDYGPVAGFWWGDKFVASTADPDMFRNQINLFNKPRDIYEELYSPLLGESSLIFLNDTEARYLRLHLERPFSHDSCASYLDGFMEIAERMSTKWKMFDKEKHIPVKQFMLAMSLQSIMHSLFGDYFKEHESLYKFAKNFDICWLELEARLTESESSLDEIRMKTFSKAKKELEDQIVEFTTKRRELETKNDALFIDDLLNVVSSQSQVVSLILTYIFYGFQTTGNLMTWLIYYVSKHSRVQERIFHEICRVVDKGHLKPSLITDLVYTHQVIEETLRLSALIPWTARVSSVDLKMGKFTIPKNTPIIQALGVVCHSQHHWKDPLEFDPDRFESDKLKRTDSLCYPYFGFAEKRKCPANRFVYFEVAAFVSVLIRDFKISLVDPSQVAFPVYGLVTRPEDEIYATIERR